MPTFLEKLEAACVANQSLLCVGLDPDPQRMALGDVFRFNQAIVDATAGLVCAYKPNLAFYEVLGIPGLQALQQTIDYIRQRAPGVLIIGDGKRGDVGNTAQAHARALFETWGFDAATVNPFGGGDTLQPFLDYRDRGVFVWCRSSNPGAGEFQDLVLAGDGGGRRLFEIIAQKATEWNGGGNVGLVVGATYPRELVQLRELCPTLPILIPGVGAQEGALEESVRGGTDNRGRLAIISSSRQVLYASGGADFAQAARREATALRDRINRVLAEDGLGWS